MAKTQTLNLVQRVDRKFWLALTPHSPLNNTLENVSYPHYKGYFENGRRYASLKVEGNAYFPSDEKQFECLRTHMIYLVLDPQRRNPSFRAQSQTKQKYVLDVGTGDASWAIDTAERFPNRKLPIPEVGFDAKSCQ